MISALFVEKNGSYKGIEGVSIWDIDRDARKYNGPFSVVAHPPCSRWCKLANLVESLYGYRVGDDNGCFESALRSVRLYGGVLEHPAYSKAWKHFDLNTPPSTGGWVNADLLGGWTCHVEQSRYGHKAKKPTWLYAYNVDLPSMKWGKADKKETTHMVSRLSSHIDVPRLSKKEAIHTPPEFRDLLISIAESSNNDR